MLIFFQRFVITDRFSSLADESLNATFFLVGGAYNQTNISLAGKLTVNIHNSKHSDFKIKQNE